MSKSYHEYCGLARALDVLGERWTLLLVRNLLLGPQRYGELLLGLPGITTNLLAARLKTLLENEVVVRVDLPHGAEGYALTKRGRSLEPSLLTLAEFGTRDMQGGPRANDHVAIQWGMVSMKRRYQGKGRGTVQIHVDEQAFWLDYSPRYVDVRREVHPAQLVVRGTDKAIKAVLFRGKSPRLLTVDGDWGKFATAFGLAMLPRQTRYSLPRG